MFTDIQIGLRNFDAVFGTESSTQENRQRTLVSWL
jgi:hypothetical protein